MSEFWIEGYATNEQAAGGPVTEEAILVSSFTLVGAARLCLLSERHATGPDRTTKLQFDNGLLTAQKLPAAHH